jgi:hypothetical protein
MSKRPTIKVGDVYQIHLPNHKWAYAQFLQHNEQLGYLIRVFDRITDRPIDDVTALNGARHLFPPVFVGLVATLRSERWRKIGNLEIGQFEFPKFRNTIGTKPGTYHNWYIWDGHDSIKIGDLPPELRALELEMVWGDEGLEERIVAGTYRGDKML